MKKILIAVALLLLPMAALAVGVPQHDCNNHSEHSGYEQGCYSNSPGDSCTHEVESWSYEDGTVRTIYLVNVGNGHISMYCPSTETTISCSGEEVQASTGSMINPRYFVRCETNNVATEVRCPSPD